MFADELSKDVFLVIYFKLLLMANFILRMSVGRRKKQNC